MKWRRPEDIQSGLVTHLLVLLSAETVAVRIVLCTAVCQKNSKSFLFFTTSVAQGWRRPIQSRRRVWSWRLSVRRNAKSKDFWVYLCHPARRFVALCDCNLLSLTDIVADIGYQMTSSYWVQSLALDCDSRKQLVDEITFLSCNRKSDITQQCIIWPDPLY